MGKRRDTKGDDPFQDEYESVEAQIEDLMNVSSRAAGLKQTPSAEANIEWGVPHSNRRKSQRNRTEQLWQQGTRT